MIDHYVEFSEFPDAETVADCATLVEGTRLPIRVHPMNLPGDLIAVLVSPGAVKLEEFRFVQTGKIERRMSIDLDRIAAIWK